MKTPLHPSIADIPRPARIARLPVDSRGYPVPWFVADVDGIPDHRIVDSAKFLPALKERRCWICGDILGRYLTFALGPMCTVTPTVSEPPAHLECVQYAVQACPFLARPHMHRRAAGLPAGVQEAAGLPIQRNPGAMCVWTTRSFRPFQTDTGVLFRVGDPTSTAWWSGGRHATRAEVEASLASGLPILEAEARREGPVAELALQQQVQAARISLPKADEARA